MMDKSQGIKVYCRLKPLKKNDKSIKYEITNDDQSGIDVLDLKHQSYRNDQDTYKYRYNGVFNENTSQSMIFETVAVPILDKFLSGMNCTIFTYGQTCSGKTHTMYGSKEDRGIIPRSFEYLFNCTKELNYDFKMQYIEIYNEDIYDLLQNKSKKNIPFDNKIKYGIGKGGNIEFKEINTFNIKEKDQALKLLEMGNAKKNTACTSWNIKSSRSHCICTIKLKKQQNGREIKFNLVDLAGSERISNLTVNEKTLVESRSINSSLHHLNHVIHLLANPKVHVPYRNSTITSVLKGSLGTECATAMITTVVLNHQCIAESMSTCRFSKEVTAIKYRVQKKIKIKKKKQYKELKDVLEEEKAHEQLSGGFRSKAKENKIILVNKTTNTENNEDLINESIGIRRVLHDELKDDGICMNVAYDVHDDRSKPDDFAVGDGVISVPAVDVKVPPVMESGDGINDTHDNSKLTKNAWDLEVEGIIKKLTTDDSDKEHRPDFAENDNFNSNVQEVRDMQSLFVEYGVGTEDSSDDGICMNVAYDVHDDRSKPDDFAVGDGVISVPAVDVTAPPVMESGDGINDIQDNSKLTKVGEMLPLFVECGVGTEDILVTRSEHDDKNINTPLKNSLINRASNFFWRHKMIQLILIILILILNSQFLISTGGFDIHSLVPEWLKSSDPAKLCPDGINNLQTFCCCGKCLRVCVKTIKDKINAKVIDSFCDCQLASSVTDSHNTASDHRLFKGSTWSDQMFDEYLTFIKSTVKISICVFIMLFIIILIAMVLYKLFRLQQSSNDVNFDKSDTQNNKQPSSITVNIGPEKLPTCIDEKCQHIYFNTKFGSRDKVRYGRQYKRQTPQRPVVTLSTATKGNDDKTQSTLQLTPQKLSGTGRQVPPDEYRPREYTSSGPITEIERSSSPSPSPSSAIVTAQQTPTTTHLQEQSTINLCQGRISRNTSQCLIDHKSSEDHRSGTYALDESTKATKTPKTGNPVSDSRSGFKRYGFRRWI